MAFFYFKFFLKVLLPKLAQPVNTQIRVYSEQYPSNNSNVWVAFSAFIQSVICIQQRGIKRLDKGGIKAENAIQTFDFLLGKAK